MSWAVQDVTKAQAKERANARTLHNQHTLDRYIGPESPDAAFSHQPIAGKPHIMSRQNSVRALLCFSQDVA